MDNPLKISIRSNLVYLTENLSNISRVLRHFVQDEYISQAEKGIINSNTTDDDKNEALFETLMKKSLKWETLKRVLTLTGNGHLADEIEGTLKEMQRTAVGFKNKWWPEEKTLPRAFNDQRKQNGQLVVEELRSLLEKSENGVIVITGLGGVGKSATAKWYARQFGDSYDQIIWIDSDKNRIENSYKKLANELKIDESKDCVYGIKDIAGKIFERLSSLKCLWILDNAEEYIGNHGIQGVLPKRVNFHSIITSRTREWGNPTGYGKIPEYPLDVFGQNDSISFLRKYLVAELVCNHRQLRRICDLVENLPLALQIVVATLNRRKIEINEYIERLKSTDHILNKEFDDYDRTINKTMTISLELIKNNENKDADLASNILQIFGYLRSDDISLEFFKAIMDTSRAKINEAVDLLENYSLVSKKIGIQFLSIHRLLQKVIRVNGKASESEILGKILNCPSSANGDPFLEFKLTPFKFADEALKKKFPNLQHQLIDQVLLTRLLQQNRLEEAVELSKMIQTSLQLSTAARYNYALCLEKSGEIDKAMTILESLYQECEKDIEKSLSSICHIDSYGIMDINKKAPTAIIGGKLFLMYTKDEGKIKELVKQLIKHRGQIGMKLSTAILSTIVTSVDELNIPYYAIACDSDWIVLKFLEEQLNMVELKKCCIEKSFCLPKSVRSLTFGDVDIKEKSTPLMSFQFNPTAFGFLNELHISKTPNSASTEFVISLHNLESIAHITLNNCSIDVSCGGKISPKVLNLSNVFFLQGGLKPCRLKEAVVNNYVDLHQMTCLRLTCLPLGSTTFIQDFYVQNEKRSELFVDFSTETSIDDVVIENVGVRNLKSSKWNIKTLCLIGVPFVEENQLSVIDMTVLNSCINLSSIPKTIERLRLFLGLKFDKPVIGNFSAPLENLRFLHLQFDSLSLLPHFSNCRNLKTLVLSFTTIVILHGGLRFIEPIPKFIKNLQLETNEKEATVNNFILTEFKDFLEKCQCCDLLVIHFMEGVRVSRDADMGLLIRQNSLKTILIGKFLWEDDEKWEDFALSSFVDKKAECYQFENGFGKALENNDFNGLIEQL